MDESNRDRICNTSDTSWEEIHDGETDVKKASAIDWSAIFGVNNSLITVKANSWQSLYSRIFHLKRARINPVKSARICNFKDVGSARTIDSTRVIIRWFEDFNSSVSMFYSLFMSHSPTINIWAIRTSFNVLILSKIADKCSGVLVSERSGFCKRITLATIYLSQMIFGPIPHPSILINSNLGALLWYSILFCHIPWSPSFLILLCFLLWRFCFLLQLS